MTELESKQDELIYQLSKQPNAIGREWRERVEKLEAEIAALKQGEPESDELLNPDEFVPIDIQSIKINWNKTMNVPNSGWNDIERDLISINNKSLPLTLRTYLVNKMAYCVIKWMRNQLNNKR